MRRLMLMLATAVTCDMAAAQEPASVIQVQRGAAAEEMHWLFRNIRAAQMFQDEGREFDDADDMWGKASEVAHYDELKKWQPDRKFLARLLPIISRQSVAVSTEPKKDILKTLGPDGPSMLLTVTLGRGTAQPGGGISIPPDFIGYWVETPVINGVRINSRSRIVAPAISPAISTTLEYRTVPLIFSLYGPNKSAPVIRGKIVGGHSGNYINAGVFAVDDPLRTNAAIKALVGLNDGISNHIVRQIVGKVVTDVDSDELTVSVDLRNRLPWTIVGEFEFAIDEAAATSKFSIAPEKRKTVVTPLAWKKPRGFSKRDVVNRLRVRATDISVAVGE